jgi:hypothetical protein
MVNIVISGGFIYTYCAIIFIRRHFGKQMNKETKLRIHNITDKTAFGIWKWSLGTEEKTGT